MYKKWEIFEIECYNYLNRNYKNIEFKYHGRSNSTVSDIEVIDRKFFFFF